MGICKCRKPTDLFCFVHRKAVCYNCISEHPTCVVKSYLAWLQDPEYDAPSCPLCSVPFTATESNPTDPNQSLTIRLQCLDVFHKRCLDNCCAALPNTTARAGVVCPSCSRSVFPPDDAPQSTLLAILKQYLINAQWALKLGLVELQPHIPNGNTTENDIIYAEKDSSQSREPPISPSVTGYGGPFSRKRPVDATVEDVSKTTFDADEDKYRRRGIMQLLAALGLVSSGNQSGEGSFRLFILLLVIAPNSTPPEEPEVPVLPIGGVNI